MSRFDEAIEAAAKALFEVRDDPYDMDEWDDIDSTEREPYLCQARAALETAAPHLMAQAWESGRNAGRMDPSELYPSTNPYRSKALSEDNFVTPDAPTRCAGSQEPMTWDGEHWVHPAGVCEDERHAK